MATTQRRYNALSAVLLVAFALVLCASVASGQGFGSRLLRTFFVFSEQPLTASVAASKGWYRQSNTCNPTYGIPYSETQDGPSSTYPVTLYYTAAGQLAGFGVRVKGYVAPYLVQRGFWRQVDSEHYDIFIRTRDPKYMCSGAKTPDVVGDRLEIGGFFNIPLNTSDAVKQGWLPGNCIGKMGMHYAYDLAAPGRSTWNASTLVPVQPMYDAQRKTINAILFNIPHWEWTEPVGEFEGPFPNNLFCLNWCKNTGCGFDGVSLWTTMHFHFVDPSSISCAGAPCAL